MQQFTPNSASARVRKSTNLRGGIFPLDRETTGQLNPFAKLGSTPTTGLVNGQERFPRPKFSSSPPDHDCFTHQNLGPTPSGNRNHGLGKKTPSSYRGYPFRTSLLITRQKEHTGPLPPTKKTGRASGTTPIWQRGGTNLPETQFAAGVLFGRETKPAREPLSRRPAHETRFRPGTRPRRHKRGPSRT